jgi:putative transcriptional regulator
MNKLKEIRMKNNISQELLACKVGVTVRYIAFLESGARKPSIDVAFKIAKVLKATVDDIFLPRKCTKCSQT